MKEDINDIELVEKFLEGNLTAEEARLFEERRSHDEAFGKMLQDMELLVAGIRRSAESTSMEEKLRRLQFYAEIADLEETVEREGPTSETKVVPLSGRRWFLAAAASLALLVTVGLWYNSNPTHDPEQLFVAYFEPFDSPGSGVTRGNEGLTSKGAAYDAYDNGRYADAIVLFEKLLAENNDPIILLCLGNAELKMGNVQEAETSFTRLLREHKDLVTQAKWYLALTYLKGNNLAEAKKTLSEITGSSTYGENAQSLLKELN